MKTGLVIGINYVGTSHELQGCVRDAEQVYHMLKYDLAYDQVTLMTGESSGRNRATKANIIGNIQRMVSSAKSGDQLFLHYSGHGTQVLIIPAPKMMARMNVWCHWIQIVLVISWMMN